MTPSPEQELLILATRLDLSPDQEARAAALLEEPWRWDVLLGLAGQFGMLPLLHRHLGRPALAGRVPAEVREALAKGYLRTSMKNLRILDLLQKILAEARAEGVPVLLLKGAYLARWMYGDAGLRPMGDLDLLCRKEDEPALERLFQRMGAFRAATPADPDPGLSPVRLRVKEATGHGLPWWFRDVCRVEVHYRLLARGGADAARTRQELWDGAMTLDWDGLEVRALAPAPQLIHLATHFLHHIQEEGPFYLYWLTDVREMWRRHRGSPELEGLEALARRLKLDRDCAEVFDLLGEPWDGRAAVPAAEASRRLAAHMDVAALGPRTTAAHYLEVLLAVRHAGGFKDKARYLRDVYLPPAWRMERRYGTANRYLLPFLYAVDPFVRIFGLLRGKFGPRHP